MKNILVVFVLVVVILAAGCTGTNQISSPGTPAPTAAAMTATGQAPIGDLRTPAAAVTTVTPVISTTPIKIATAKIDGLYWPYVREQKGKYYFQPVGFVCTEANPTWVSLGPNWTDQAIWCER